jgi:predicted nuclease with TOPRIM domain
MEKQKNEFEILYKKKDESFRDIENKLQQEKSEKQRLELTTKSLNMELKTIKERLQSLEKEKDSLNHRCIQLKEERDNHGMYQSFTKKRTNKGERGRIRRVRV